MKKIIKFLLAVFVIVGLLTAGAVVLIDDSVNILVYGLEGKRSDVMMLVMVDSDKNETHVISIPRDTYNPTVGHNGLGAKKQNAVYGFKEGGGPEGLVSSIEKLVNIEIDYFVEIKYEGVKSVVDLVGGVPVNVPFDMVYDDPYASPPLHIDIKAGEQVIGGDDAIGYLRFRKSNDGKIREGDIQRIDRQQLFLKSAAKEALTFKLPLLAKEALEYVETDLNTFDMLKLSLGMLGTSQEDVYFHVLPQEKIGTGDDGLSYVFHSKEGTVQLLEAIRNGDFKKDELKDVE
jgi:LCP family protein required for cell wall assembly